MLQKKVLISTELRELKKSLDTKTFSRDATNKVLIN
jgi:hypothetical protein